MKPKNPKKNRASTLELRMRNRVLESQQRGDELPPTLLRTISGKTLDFRAIDPESIDISDIAHSLSMQCRFHGHIKSFYSVAQHSVGVSYACDPEDAFHGLMHDAHEAYIGDLARPFKNWVPLLRSIEDLMSAQVLAVFNLPAEQPESVTRADNNMLATEARDLCDPDWPWETIPGAWPLPDKITPLPPMEACKLFVARYTQLCALSTQTKKGSE